MQHFQLQSHFMTVINNPSIKPQQQIYDFHLRMHILQQIEHKFHTYLIIRIASSNSKTN